MKTLNLTLIVLMGSITIGLAQDYTFKVMVNKGANEVKSGSDWRPVKTGAALKAEDELKVSENSYLGLVHANGKPVEIKQAGTYSVAKLAQDVSGGTSVLAKYTDFILSANTEKGNRLQATGAVHRGPQNIILYLPPSEIATAFNNEMIITWSTDKVKGPYRIEFQSMFGDELAKIETPDGSVRINLSDKKFKNEDNINVFVVSLSVGGESSEKLIIKRLSKGDTERIKGALDQIDDAVSSKDALGLYYFAGFYESNRLLIDAITCYQKAIEMEPGVYNEYFQEFLIRNGLVEVKK